MTYTIIPATVKVDEETIDKNSSGELEIKGGGVGTSLLENSSVTIEKVDSALTGWNLVASKEIQSNENTNNIVFDNLPNYTMYKGYFAVPGTKAGGESLNLRVNDGSLLQIASNVNVNYGSRGFFYIGKDIRGLRVAVQSEMANNAISETKFNLGDTTLTKLELVVSNYSNQDFVEGCIFMLFGLNA